MKLRPLFSLRYFLPAILVVVMSGCGGGSGGSENQSGIGDNAPANELTVIASGSVGPSGGTVSDSSGETAVIVPPGAVTTTTSIQILRGRNADGDVMTNFTAEPPTSDEVRIVLPDPDLLEASIPSGSGTSARTLGALSANLSAATTSNPTSDYPIHAWPVETWGYFLDSHLIGFGNRIPNQDHLTRLNELNSMHGVASKLFSVCPFNNNDPGCYQGKTAVLFVHGFLVQFVGEGNTGLGGGVGTWGDFPKLLNLNDPDDPISVENGYRSFEFRWATAARFEDVADDLCQAVDFIARKTGKQVHIVAHSFGGVLTRVFLQGLSTKDCSSREKVASVTTIGSPHSGLFDSDKTAFGISFKRGQDSQGGVSGNWQINACRQLSCYQMGEAIGFNSNLKEVAKYGISPVPGEIAARLSKEVLNLPPVPIQVLIGLTTSRGDFSSLILDEGDGLISYEGQRFLPDFTANKSIAGYSSLLQNGAGDAIQYGFRVTEKILGFDDVTDPDAVRPGGTNPLAYSSTEYVGYRHTGFMDGNYDLFPAKDAIKMACVGCNVIGALDHSGYKLAKKWIGDHPASVVNRRAPFTLRVTVFDEKSSTPVSGASLKVKANGYVQNDPIVTGPDGSADIEVQFLPQEIYNLIVSKLGYVSKEYRAVVTTKDSQEAFIDLGSKNLVPESAVTAPVLAQFVSLSVAISGTSGTIVGDGIECPVDCTTAAMVGEQTVLTARANAGSTLSGWSGCTSVDGVKCYVTLEADKTVSASFAPTASTSPRIAVSPGILNFGNVIVGSCATHSIVIQHVEGMEPASGT